MIIMVNKKLSKKDKEFLKDADKYINAIINEDKEFLKELAKH